MSGCMEVCRLDVAASNVLMAEALVIWEGCAFARQSNFNRVIVESDSKTGHFIFGGWLGVHSFEKFFLFKAVSWNQGVLFEHAPGLRFQDQQKLRRILQCHIR